MTIKSINKYRLYYPGLISLILLPILCIYYFYQNHAFDKLNAMQVVCPTLGDMDSIFWRPNINYINITLTGNDQDDKEKLGQAQLQIRKLVVSEDTTTGIHIHFGDESKYWTLVRILDLCSIENAEHYGLYENDFWIINARKKYSSLPTGQAMCATITHQIENNGQIIEEKLTTIEFIKDFVRTYFPSALLFLLMIYQTHKQTHLHKREINPLN